MMLFEYASKSISNGIYPAGRNPRAFQHLPVHLGSPRCRLAHELPTPSRGPRPQELRTLDAEDAGN